MSPLAVLARSWRGEHGNSAWRIAAGVVLVITGIAWFLIQREAGYIGGAAWFLFLFLPAMGLRKMTELSLRHDYSSARRLAAALFWLHPSGDLRDQIRVLRQLEARTAAGDLSFGSFTPRAPLSGEQRRWRHAPVVVSLIVVNALVFLAEQYAIWKSPNDPYVLLRLGALEPSFVVFAREYWRLFTALFLHATTLHLLFNVFALYVLGPQLERSIGSVRFLVCYLVAGFCSSAGIVVLWRMNLIPENEVVGASGCIMGIVGAWAAFLLRNPHLPQVRRRLVNVLMIVVIQTIFDLTTPQVSMSAHLCGLMGGFVIGLILAPSVSSYRPAPQ